MLSTFLLPILVQSFSHPPEMQFAHHLHTEILRFQIGDYLGLMTNLHCILERLEDIIPHHNWLLCLGVDMAFDIKDIAWGRGWDRGRRDLFVDRANGLREFLILDALGHFFVVVCGVSVSAERNRRGDEQCVCDGGR